MIEIEKAEDSTLIGMIKNSNSESALSELINRHSGIYIKMVTQLGKQFSQNQIQDILDDKSLMIYRAALDFDELKSKFSTYLANRTKYLCLSHRTKNKQEQMLVPIESVEPFLNESSSNPMESCSSNDSYQQIIDKLLDHKDERVKTIFYERYFNGERGKMKPWKEVAKLVKLSPQGCINVHDKALKDLKKEIKKNEIKF